MTHNTTWEKCLLGRSVDATKLENYLKIKCSELMASIGNPRGHTLNLDAKWGEGKTTFIDCWQEQLNHNHVVIRFDAWKTDFMGDPLVAFIGTMDSQLQMTEFLKGSRALKTKIKKSLVTIKNALPILIEILSRHLLKMGTDEAIKVIMGTDDADKTIDLKGAVDDAAQVILATFKQKENSIKAIKNSLSEMVNAVKETHNKYLPIYIFVDELDRCRPTYAIEVLEIIKHIFSVPGIQFVVATDTIQLEHTVKAIYGEQFDAKRYLRRFFDDRYTFPESDYEPIFDSLLKNDASQLNNLIALPALDFSRNGNRISASKILHAYAQSFGWSVRDQIQIFEQLKRIILFNFSQEKKCHLILLLYFLAIQNHLAKMNISLFTNALPQIAPFRYLNSKAAQLAYIYLEIPTLDFLLKKEIFLATT